MFVVRSAFWLSAAFLIMAPGAGMDVGESARATGKHLANQGVQAVSDTLTPSDCLSVECAVGRTVLAQIAVPQTSVAAKSAFPPPRPDWAY
jgi:hypothetical protein